MGCCPKRFLYFLLFSVSLCLPVCAERWLVRVPKSKTHRLYQIQGLSITHEYRHIPWLVVEATKEGGQWLRLAVKDKQLQAEPDRQVRLAALPNDPLLSSQLYIQPANPAADIYLPRAWDFQTTASSLMAVIDSGVDITHPDLVPNLWRNPLELNGSAGVDDDYNGYVDDIYGWNTMENNGNVSDTFNHGSRVTGIIGARGNNGLGITGVCWACNIMEVRSFGAGVGNLTNLLAGLDYVFNFPQVRVINASWALDTYQQSLTDAINIAAQKGMVVVTAVGNIKQNIDTSPVYPASLDVENVIAVAGIQQDGHLWDTGDPNNSSGYGTVVAVAAPAANIISTHMGNSYQNGSGTSYAVPHVVGAIAMLLEREPGLTPGQVKERVINTSRRTSELMAYPLGGGLLDVRSLLLPPAAAQAWWRY